MASHRNPYVQDESECSCACTCVSPSSPQHPASTDPEVSISYLTNHDNMISTGSMATQVNNGFGDYQPHQNASKLAVPKYDVHKGANYEPCRPQMTYDNAEEEICCDGCGEPIENPSQKQEKIQPHTSSMRGGKGEPSPSQRTATSNSKPNSGLPEYDFASTYHDLVRKSEKNQIRDLQAKNNSLKRQARKYKERWESAEEAVEMCSAILQENQEVILELRDKVEEMRVLKRLALRRFTEEKEVGELGAKGKEKKKADEVVKSEERKGKGKEIVKSEEKKDEKEVLETKYFYFYPKTSTVVLPGLPARILRFRRGADLPGIHDYLNHQFKLKNERDEAAKIVRKIMDANIKMGIELPDHLREQAVVINIPEGYEDMDFAPGPRIAAWRTVEGEDGYDEILPWQYEEMPLRPKITVKAPEPTANDRVQPTIDIPELSAFITPEKLNAPSPAFPSPPSSTCSCALCVSERDPCVLIHPFMKPLVSVRGGEGDNEDYGDHDDYDDDDYYDDDGYYDDEDAGYDSAVSDYEEEVQHEDEADDPYDDGW